MDLGLATMPELTYILQSRAQPGLPSQLRLRVLQLTSGLTLLVNHEMKFPAYEGLCIQPVYLDV